MRAGIAMAVGTLCLSACTLPLGIGPAAQQVRIEGQTYQISQLTDSTWMAASTDTGKPLGLSASGRRALLDAIASASGCQVSDSDDSRQGMQLDAQVDCGSKLDYPVTATPPKSAPQAGWLSTK